MEAMGDRKQEKDTVRFDKVEINVTERAMEDGETESVKNPPPASKILEVQSAVDDEEDDVTMLAETFRAYTIGIFFTLIASAISNVSDLRTAPLVIQASIVQLIALPVGRYWGRYIPDKRIGFGKWSFRLNPGPFTVKEHALIAAMANCGAGYPPYAVGLVILQIVKYEQNFGIMYNLMLLVGTEMLGYGLAGLCRRWLLYPSDMIWPEALQTVTFLNTMHRDKNEPVGRWTISRYRLFFWSLLALFCYSFIPQIFSFFEQLPILTMIWPQSKTVNLLFGTKTGLALLPLTLSYQTVITFLGPPQIVPAYAHFNIFAGAAFWFWLVAGILYATNHWDSQYFPIGSPKIYTNTAKPYDVSKILTKDKTLDEEAYKGYSPLLQGPRIALAYALSFASIACVLVHVALYDGRMLLSRMRLRRDMDEDDPNMQAMRNYPETPEWWYQVLFGTLFVLSIVLCVVWPTYLPWWGFIITMLIPIIFILPIGVIQARTNQQIGLNVITEFVAGYIWPGKPIANTLVKIFGYMAMSKGLLFVSDLKMGVYMKVPPRAMFRFQVIGSFVSNFTALAVITALIKAVPTLCDPETKSGFTCPGLNVFYRATVIWGLIAPGRIFSPGAPYGDSLWYFLVGALAPIPFFLAKRKWPKSWVRYVNIPLVLSGGAYIPPASLVNYTSWGAIGVFFNGWVMTRHPAWWKKYNYILANGLYIGVTLCELLVSMLAVGGVDISEKIPDPLQKFMKASLDSGTGVVLKTVKEGETIGPKTWS